MSLAEYHPTLDARICTRANRWGARRAIGRFFAVKNFTHKEATTAIVVSYYWHFVDVVWIGLFLVIYVIR